MALSLFKIQKSCKKFFTSGLPFVIASILVFQTQTNQNETILLTDGDWWEFSETLSWHFSEILVLNCPLDYLRQSTFCVNLATKQLPRRSSCIYVREVVDSYQIPLLNSEKNDLPKPNYTQKELPWHKLRTSCSRSWHFIHRFSLPVANFAHSYFFENLRSHFLKYARSKI